MTIKTTAPDLAAAYTKPKAQPYRFKSRTLSLIEEEAQLIISVTLVVWIFCITYALFGYTPKYVSEAAILIKDSAVKANYVTTDVVETTSALSSNSVLNTMELLKSEALGEALWTRFIQKHPEIQKRLHIKNFMAWKRYYGNGKRLIKYKNTAGTDVINISFKWNRPALAQEGLSIIIKAFQAISLNLNQSEHRQRYLYLTRQIDQVRQQLNVVRTQISDVKQSHTTPDIDEELASYSRKKVETEYELNVTEAEANNYHTQMDAYQSSLNMSPRNAVIASAIGGNTTLASLYQQSYQLSNQLAQLKTRYTDANPKVKDITSQLKQIQNNIALETRRMGIKTSSAKASELITDKPRGDALAAMLDAQARYEGLNQKSDQMRHYIEQMDTKIKALPHVEQTLADLKQQESSLSTALSTLEDKALDAKLREAQTLSNIFVMDQPSLPTDPSFPTQPEIIILGLFLGTGTGFAIALLKQKLVMLDSHDLPEGIFSEKYRSLQSHSK